LASSESKVAKEKYINDNDFKDGYKVRITLGQTNVRQRVFVFASYEGDKEKTMAAAKAWRDEVAAELGIVVTKAHAKKAHKDKPPDLVGLALILTKHAGLQWRASMPNRKIKQFAVSKFGYKGAYTLARLAREEHAGTKLRVRPPRPSEIYKPKYKKLQYTKPVLAKDQTFYKHKPDDLKYLSLLHTKMKNGMRIYRWSAYLGMSPAGKHMSRNFACQKHGYESAFKQARELVAAAWPELKLRETAPTLEEMEQYAVLSVRRKGRLKDEPHGLLID
jgi:hypothetical protein